MSLSRKHKKRRPKYNIVFHLFTPKGFLTYVLIILFLSGCLEYGTKFQLFDQSFLFYTMLCSLATALITIIYSIVQEDDCTDTTTRKRRGHHKKRKTNAKPNNAVIQLLKLGMLELWYGLYKNKKRFLAFFIVFTLTISSALAYCNVPSALLKEMEDIHQTMTQEVTESFAVSAPVISQKASQTPSPTPTPIPIPTPTPQDGVFVLEDPDRELELEQDLSQTIYFLEGKFAIKNWEDQEEVQDAVRRYIRSNLSQAKPNYFDKYATQEIKNRAAYASELEEHLRNSTQLEEIISTREDIFVQYPCLVLARMVAESYHRFALEYIKANGTISTIEYYYGHSIQWLTVSLSYAGSDQDAVHNILNSLQMRYHDLWSEAPPGSDMARYAEYLYKAFKAVRSEF